MTKAKIISNVILVLVIISSACIFFHFEKTALLSHFVGVDEGIYAYETIHLNTYCPYKDLNIQKTPGIFLLGYPAYKLFPNFFTFRIVGVIFTLLCIILTLILAKRLYSITIACFALIFLLLEPNMVFWNARFLSDYSYPPFIIFATIFYFHALDSNKPIHFFLSGLCIGLSFLLKQYGMFLQRYPLI